MKHVENAGDVWMKKLTETTAEFLLNLESVNASLTNQHPFNGGWSIGQVVEHIHKSDKGMIFFLSGPSKKGDRPPDQHIPVMEKIFLNFNEKLNSPDFIIPEDKIYEKDNLIFRFKNERQEILEILEKADLTETCTAAPFPGIGEVTRLEILAFVNVHTQRHIHQLKRIVAKIANPNIEY